MVVATLILIGSFFSNEPIISSSECKTTLQCWGDKHSVSAAARCQRPIERLAKYSHKWTDELVEPKMSRFRWKNKEKGIITYLGDKIQFQNGFGAWQNVIYECDYDPATKKVLDIRITKGLL